MPIGHVDGEIGVVDYQKEDASQKICGIGQHQVIDGGTEWCEE
jgi:hypothetical protein